MSKAVLENEAKIPKEIWKSNPTSEEQADEYEQWCHTTQKERAEWEKSLKDIPEEEINALSEELEKCPCPWEHMNAFKILKRKEEETEDEEEPEDLKEFDRYM
jgi:hypothetical protein